MSEDLSCGCGCLVIVVTVIALWALVFGVSHGGKHYEFGCSCDRGVEINE